MDIDPLPDQGRGIGGRDHFVVAPVPNRDFRPFPLPRRRLTHQMGFPKNQWKSIRTSNAIERLHEEFKRRIKTLIVLPSAETAAINSRRRHGSPAQLHRFAVCRRSLKRPRLISLRDATNFATEAWRELREIRI